MSQTSASELGRYFNRVDGRSLKQEITGAYICGPYTNALPRNWFLVFTSHQTAWQLHLAVESSSYKPDLHPTPLGGFEANFASGQYYLARMGRFETQQGVTLQDIIDLVYKKHNQFQLSSSRRGSRDFCLKVLATLSEAYLFKEMHLDKVRFNLVEAFGEIHPIFPYANL